MQNRLVILLVSMSLGACGFHLRGANDFELELSEIYIVVSDNYGDLHRMLNGAFTQAGVTVVTTPSDLAYNLSVSGERHTRRAVATTRTISVSEYELRLEVRIALTNLSGEEIFPMSTLGTERIYTFDRGSLVGSIAEEKLLREEMRADLVRQILRRVDASIRSFEAVGNIEGLPR
jgi:LPS-assembly lipoprotein